MTRRITLPVAAFALFGCGPLAPTPTGHVEGRVIICVTYRSSPKPVCDLALRNVEITLDGAGPTKTATLDSGVFWFSDLEVGSYTLYAFYTGATDLCLYAFEQTSVSVAEDQTANVVIDGKGRC